MATKLDDSQINSSMLNTAVGDVAKIYASLLEIKGQLNYTTSYTYNTNGQVETETISGDFSKTTSYTYYPSGTTYEGKIETETINDNTRETINTYQYDNTTGNVTIVTTSTTLL